MNVIEEKCVDFYGNETTSLRLDVKNTYTISEFIGLLNAALDKFGDKKILINDTNTNTICGFSTIYLNHGFDSIEKCGEDYYKDDSVCILC